MCMRNFTYNYRRDWHQKLHLFEFSPGLEPFELIFRNFHHKHFAYFCIRIHVELALWDRVWSQMGLFTSERNGGCEILRQETSSLGP